MLLHKLQDIVEPQSNGKHEQKEPGNNPDPQNKLEDHMVHTRWLAKLRVGARAARTNVRLEAKWGGLWLGGRQGRREGFALVLVVRMGKRKELVKCGVWCIA